ncbi:MAG: hypothetical protein RBT36_05935, partial [Desulfobulbus sp.]|nr:hypothetical protein [Desulfobulbus sp.]
MNTPTILLVIGLCFILFAAPRRFFLFPFIMAACFVPMNQRFILLDLDFTVIRMLVLAGLLRLLIRGEVRVIQWNNFDKLVLSWVVVGSLVYAFQQMAVKAVIYKAGVMFDSLGMYWLFRQVIHDWEDVFHAMKIFAIFAIITAPLIALEKFQDSSFFSLFGPVTGKFHRERFRAAGPFPHYIIMGCFWASLLPFFYARIKTKKNVVLYWLAIIAAVSNVYFSASSTPLLTIVAIVIFWKLYTIRMHGKNIFLGACLGILTLHLIMKAPVWHLLSRVGFFGGSTGWHRYFLFDNFVKHFSEWFLLGTKSTAHWGYGQTDLTNQFVLEGVRGGVVT